MPDQSNMLAAFDKPEVQAFLRILSEAARASHVSGPNVYVPPAGSDLASANYHYFIFGQRGSGKSSLMHHLRKELHDTGRIGVWIDEEVFSKLTFPDVLVSAVLETMEGVLESLPDESQSWWRRMFGMPKETGALQTKRQLRKIANNLRALKQSPDDRQIEWTHSLDTSGKYDVVGHISVGQRVGVKGGVEQSQTAGTKSVETVQTSKQEYLERALADFRKILIKSGQLTEGGFVFVDDLYHLRREDQPKVLGYMHRLLKDTGVWLKIGTLRNMTTTYRDNPPEGMQLRHDAQEIALDRQFNRYGETQRFLETILQELAEPAGVETATLFTRGALDRLMLASGGVARDYIDLARRSIERARSRGVGTKSGSERIIVEDVNESAAEVAPTKMNDLKVDAPEHADKLQDLLYDLTEFCRETKCSYFMIDNRQQPLSDEVFELQNLRFAHLIHENETVPDRSSQRFNVWMLDLAMLSHQRAAQRIDFSGWQDRERRRQRKLIYTPEWRTMVEARKPKASERSQQSSSSGTADGARVAPKHEEPGLW